MSTTLLFAELLIIGLQVFLWLFLLILNLIGYSWMYNFSAKVLNEWQTPLAILLLSSAYVLGIIFDRLADSLFLKWDVRLKNRILPAYLVPIGVMRFEITKDNPHLNEQFEYTRSRMRIARASGLNFGIITLLAITLINFRPQGLNQFEKIYYTISAMSVGTMLTFSAVYAWHKLMSAYFTFVKANYDHYKQKESPILISRDEGVEFLRK